MPIIVCGMNHKTAPLALRERVVFPVDKLPLYLADLVTHEKRQEAVILSTCNRSELYCEAEDVEPLIDWFCRQHHITRAELLPAFYVHRDEAAVRHIMQVACGLDSMMLGESQILGQMKEAFSESCAAGAVGPLFHRLFQQVFAVAKEVRTNTAIGACPVSVASAAVGLAKQLYPALSQATVLVIGAGDTAELVLRYLTQQPPARIMMVNRNQENAVALAAKYPAEVMPFAALTTALTQADVVISATGSAVPVVTEGMMTDVLAKRAQSAITLIDIAVPRDIEAAVATLPGVTLRCIDDLKSIIQHNLRGREHAADKAQEVIAAKSKEFVAWLQSLDLVTLTIRAYRQQIEAISQAEMAKAARHLQRGDDPLQVLAAYAHAMTNKLLHTPSAQLRQAGVDGRVDILQIAQQLFAIPSSEAESA